MLNRIIAFSLQNRLFVLAAAAALVVYGGYVAANLPVDVFPDLNRPTVTILTEAPGLAPEEVEVQVSRPLEYLLNGATGVRRVRSASGIGLSIVWVEFEWGSDIFRDRQVVAEKLPLARERLPRDVHPEMAPISSIMGEIMLVGLRSTAEVKTPEEQAEKAMELRTLAEFTLRNRLQPIEGVAQVNVIGGVLRQFQVVTSPARLASHDVSVEQLAKAAQEANAQAGGGIIERSTSESLIRFSGRSLTLKEIEETPVVWREQVPVLIKDVAQVRFGGPVARGSASVRLPAHGPQPVGLAVILTIQKQPHANTLLLDAEIDRALRELEPDLPAGVKLESQIFKQADFIRSAIHNVEEAIRDGALWVFLILFVFLWNIRTSLITLTAIPLSILITALVFHYLGVTINTMTLGGIAVAVGELVDDAIVDVENIYRRLRLAVSDQPSAVSIDSGDGVEPVFAEPALTTIYHASTEVRNSIVYATLVVCLVVLPLFALGGLEGRMFAPLGLGYLVSLAASLLVSLTVTPVLASYLLTGSRRLAQELSSAVLYTGRILGVPIGFTSSIRRFLERSPLERQGDPFLLRWLKKVDEKVVRFSLRHAKAVLAVVAGLVVLSCLSILAMGGEFLPPFNEGTLTINVVAEPGTSLEESERLGRRAEDLILQVPEVLSVARRTGRAEMDEHAEGVNSSELDVRLQEHEQPRAGPLAAGLRAVPGLHSLGYDHVGRPRDQVMGDIRGRVTLLPGVQVNIGQPIAHRLDHILSGVRAQIAVKIYGPDLSVLRAAAADIEGLMRGLPGVVDLQVEPQVEVPQLRLVIKRDEARKYGLTSGAIARLLETAYKGTVVSEIIDEDRRFDLVVWYDRESRSDPKVIGDTRIDTPSGAKVALNQVVAVEETTGPNTINREGVQRRIVVSCNVQGRDLARVVSDIQRVVAPIEQRLKDLPAQGSAPYRVEYGGQFEAQQQANRRLLLLGTLAVFGVFLLLYTALETWQAALQVMVNIPLAAIGSVVALLLVNRPAWAKLTAAPFWQWPGIWIGETHLSVAHWVGFITLVGIVSRNGILMISHYIHLMRHEGEKFDEAMIVRGSLERLAPVLMTAGVAIMGLVPLALGAGQTGKEILHPLAIVVIGGLLVSTLLDQLVTPALFYKFGRNAYRKADSVAQISAGPPVDQTD